MTETSKVTTIAKESNGKKDKTQNLWKMFRRKKGDNVSSTSQMSKLQKRNAKNISGNTLHHKSPFLYEKLCSTTYFL